MIEKRKIGRILIAKLRHHGDVLLTSPLFAVLKKNFPDAEIDAYIYQETLPMLEGLPEISDFHLYDKKWKKKSFLIRIWKEIQLLLNIRKASYDLVLNLTEGDRGALAAWISGATYRVGFDPEGKGLFGKKRLYTHMARICHRERHTVERHFDILRAIGVFPSEIERELNFVVSDDDQKIVQEKLHQIGIISDKFIVMHAVSRWLFKCWPVTSFAKLGHLLRERGYEIILTASKEPEELAIIERIQREFPFARSLAGEISLKQLGALLKKTKLLITVDSVPLHLASALKTPVVVMFGPTSEKTWAPWKHPLARVITEEMPCRPCHMAGCGGSGKSDCLEKIQVHQVLSAAFQLLKEVEVDSESNAPLCLK